MSGGDKDPYVVAAEQGCAVVVPAANELFVDIDNETNWRLFLTSLEILNRDKPLPSHWRYVSRPSKSGEPFHFHVIVTMDREITDERVRLGLQAMLGSDLVRECLCWNRIEKGMSPVTVFFEPLPKLLTEGAAQ